MVKVVNVAGIDSPFVVLLAVVGLAAVVVLAAVVSMILCSSLFFDFLHSFLCLEISSITSHVASQQN